MARKLGSHSSNAVAPIEFSDVDWERIVKIVRLPKDARLRIGAALAQFISERRAATTSQKSKRAVQKARGYAVKLNAALAELLDDEVLLSAGQPYWSSRPRLQESDLQGARSALMQVDALLENAYSRMTMKPGRKSIAAIDHLVQLLNWIQADESEDNVQRSGKDSDKGRTAMFVTLCCKRVGLTQGQVNRALTRNAASFHSTLTEYGFDTSVGRRISKNHRPKSRRSRTKRTPDFLGRPPGQQHRD